MPPARFGDGDRDRFEWPGASRHQVCPSRGSCRWNQGQTWVAGLRGGPRHARDTLACADMNVQPERAGHVQAHQARSTKRSSTRLSPDFSKLMSSLSSSAALTVP